MTTTVFNTNLHSPYDCGPGPWFAIIRSTPENPGMFLSDYGSFDGDRSYWRIRRFKHIQNARTVRDQLIKDNDPPETVYDIVTIGDVVDRQEQRQ